jgi:hypothetical protein
MPCNDRWLSRTAQNGVSTVTLSSSEPLPKIPLPSTHGPTSDVRFAQVVRRFRRMLANAHGKSKPGAEPMRGVLDLNVNGVKAIAYVCIDTGRMNYTCQIRIKRT